MRRFAAAALAAGLALAGIAAGPAQAQSAASAYTTGYRYDIGGRQVGMIAPDPDGTGAIKFAATRSTYDAAGNLTKVESGELAAWMAETVAPSAWTGFTVFTTVDTTYDDMGRKLKVTMTAGGTVQSVTQFSYDGFGRVECTAQRMNPAAYASLPASACTLGTEGTQGPDRITRTTYDSADQVLKIQKAVGTPLQQDYVTYTYAGYQRPSSIKDANGNLATMEYGGSIFDKITKWTFPSKTVTGAVEPTDYEQYTYDANGNRTSLRKRDGSVITYTIDALNRVTVKTVPERAGLAATHTRDVYYSYDLRNLEIAARFDSAAGEGVTSSYDGFGRLASSTITMDGVTRTLTYLVDKNGNRTQVKHPDNQLFNYQYDGLNRMKAFLQATTSLGTLTYNNKGQRTALAGGVPTAYGYDAAGRLSTLSHDLGGTATTQDVTYTLGYNPASQIVTRTTSNDAYVYTGAYNVNRNYAVNGLNQYVSAGPAAFSYDANGNLTGDGGTSFVYDVENRLVSASGAKIAALRYDPLGRLYETSAGTAATTTRFLYDGDELVGEYNSAGTLLRRYVHGPGVDEPLVWYEGAGVASSALRRLRTNWQRSVIGVTDSAGVGIAINSYDEWGIPGGGNQGRFQYTGQAWIGELGMYYYKARFYSPTLGRFMQTDPIGYEDQINLYSYTGNDPVNGVDPSGMSCEGFDNGESGAYCDRHHPEDDGPPIVVTAEKKGCGRACSVADTAASILIPGYDLGKCVVVGGCSRADWAFAALDLVPIVGKGVSKGRKLYKAGRALVRACGCFVAGTLVSTPTGLKAIETLKVGDEVLAYDQTTQTIATKKITDLIRPDPRAIYEVVGVDGQGREEIFAVTDDHPWLVAGKGWIKTADLAIFDRLVTLGEGKLLITSIRKTQRIEQTYNLNVADWHTFVVGISHVVVHNTNCKAILGQARAALARDPKFRSYFHREKQASGLAGDGAGQRNSDMDDDFIVETYQAWIDAGRP